jgi:hypothetical protein
VARSTYRLLTTGSQVRAGRRPGIQNAGNRLTVLLVRCQLIATRPGNQSEGMVADDCLSEYDLGVPKMSSGPSTWTFV